MSQLTTLIQHHQANFTVGVKKVADAVLSQPKLFAMHSAKIVGKKIGVSETTIIRFSHIIGLSGFSELQEMIQNDLYENNQLTNYLKTKMNHNIKEHSFKRSMREDINHIAELMNYISVEDLDEVVTRLLSAHQVLVYGSRGSFSLANWFAFSFNLVHGKALLFQESVANMKLQIDELPDQSVLVVFSFHRYAEKTIKLAQMAQDRDVFVIAFTDSLVSPIVEFADITLSTQFKVKSILDAAPVILSLVNSIIHEVLKRNESTFKERAEKFYLKE